MTPSPVMAVIAAGDGGLGRDSDAPTPGRQARLARAGRYAG